MLTEAEVISHNHVRVLLDPVIIQVAGLDLAEIPSDDIWSRAAGVGFLFLLVWLWLQKMKMEKTNLVTTVVSSSSPTLKRAGVNDGYFGGRMFELLAGAKKKRGG